MKKDCAPAKPCSHRRRHAYCATAIVAAATVLTLAVNTGAVLLENAYGLRADISAEQYTALTDETKTILSGLDRNIYLYYIGRPQPSDIRITELLQRYASTSPLISYKMVDPSVHPGFTQLYDPEQTGISTDSVIISDNDGLSGIAPQRYKVLSADDLYFTSAPYYNETGTMVTDYKYFRAEQKITSAVDYIQKNRTMTAVFLGGQGEKAPVAALQTDLNSLFYETRAYTLSTEEGHLDPQSDTLIVISPKQDILADEFDKISSFLEQGGKAIFLMDSVTFDEQTGALSFNNTALPNFAEILSDYGITVRRNMIVGGDPSKTFMSRTSLIPSLGLQSPVTQPLADANLSPVLSYVCSLDLTPMPDVKIDVLLEADKTSYAKTPQDSYFTFSKAPEDERGPFVIGAVAHKGSSAIAVFGSSSIVATEKGYNHMGNSRLFLSTLSSLNDNMQIGSIKPRTIYSASDAAYRLSISSGIESTLCIALAAVVVPLAVLAIGITRCSKRRRL